MNWVSKQRKKGVCSLFLKEIQENIKNKDFGDNIFEND